MKAIVVGNGPSLREHLARDDFDTLGMQRAVPPH